MRTGITVVLVGAAFVLAGCTDTSEPTLPNTTTASSAQSAVNDSDDPFGLDAMVKILSVDSPPRAIRISPDIRVNFVGRGRLVDGSPEMPSDEELRRDAENGGVKEDPSPAESGDGVFRLFNTVTRNEFQVIISARLLRDINDSRERKGLTSATEGVRDPAALEGSAGKGTLFGDPRAGSFNSSGWSNGVDTRTMLTATTSWPWRALAQFTYGGNDSRCSGTLVGPRHVITAAHCLVAEGTNNWNTITVTPGRNGVGSGAANAPYGSSTIMLNPAPGTEAWYFTPDQWRNPATVNPRQYDWGIIVIPNKLGNLTGWMGYVARDFNTLAAQSNFNRGYPSCDATFVEKPAGCQTGRLYGDSNLCNLGGAQYQGPDGWNRLISVSCDLSRGHSGSSVYHYFFDPQLGQTVPVVSMMVVSHTCFTCGPADTFPNWARRITPPDLQTISFFRQAFP